VVDALRRRDHQNHIAAINLYMTNKKDQIIATTNSYQQYLKIKETLHQVNFQQKISFYEIKEDGTIM
jgi:mRNA degradation ribonuclease J1/J2